MYFQEYLKLHIPISITYRVYTQMDLELRIYKSMRIIFQQCKIKEKEEVNIHSLVIYFLISMEIINVDIIKKNFHLIGIVLL